MKVVVLGAGGMLGRAVVAASPRPGVMPFDRSAVDVTDETAVRRALSGRPDWVINCAAWTQVDACEEHEPEATRVNGEAPGIIGRVAAQVGARVMHISTDYVFDGTRAGAYREDDPPNPLSAYGRSKLAGERSLAASSCDWSVVRTQWLYGDGPSFVRTMWRRATEGSPSRVVGDQWGAPTHVSELAAAMWRLIDLEARGVWHATAGGATTWFEVAKLIYVAAGRESTLVSSCTTAEYGAPAPRPLNGRLDCTKIGTMRAWDDVLRDWLGSGLTR